jgi:hypothetical protein
MIALENITIGADPELFLINKKTGEVVSSIGIIPGEKGNPYRSEDMPEGYGLEIDNILAEFNIPPVDNLDDFVNAIDYMKKYIQKFIKAKDSNLDILTKASMIVPEDQLQSPEAKLFGCSVDYNAYTQEPNPKPKGERTNLRSAGFHIHIGYANNNVESSLALIKYLDMYLGVPSVLMDADVKRRNLYGKAGCFRLTPYGLEYRVLSSYFLSNKRTLKWVWSGICKAINAYNDGEDFADEDLVQKAINESDKSIATQLIKDYNLA